LIQDRLHLANQSIDIGVVHGSGPNVIDANASAVRFKT
jgi:hypothetical protein